MTSMPIHRAPIKRIFDILFSLIVLVFSTPLMIVVAILVRMSSPGPVFLAAFALARAEK
jgi:lipopolysaccharide/colanic/teichoic acid biosynthesis glycosyltransferase